MISNPDYKGKWVAPQIDNPEYKGVWKAKQIDNPEFFEDKKPYMFAPFSAVGIELWTMTSGIFFDNMIITRDPDVALDYATKTWKVTHDLEQAKESSKGGPSPFAFINDGIDGAAAMATNIGVPEEHSKVAVMVTITAMLMTTMWWCCKGDDAIVVRYGELASSLTAVIGPSNGTGVPPGFGQDMPPLPGGSAR